MYCDSCWRVGNSINLYRPTGQEQSQTNAKNQLFLFGQAVHAGKYSMVRAQTQWAMRKRVNEIKPGIEGWNDLRQSN